MITYQGRSSRRAAQVARSQLAVRLGLAVYAGLSAVVALRCLVLAFGFPDTVWTVDTILGASDPVVLPVRFFPGAERGLVNTLTLADLTVALILIALPLPFLGRRARVAT